MKAHTHAHTHAHTRVTHAPTHHCCAGHPRRIYLAISRERQVVVAISGRAFEEDWEALQPMRHVQDGHLNTQQPSEFSSIDQQTQGAVPVALAVHSLQVPSKPGPCPRAPVMGASLQWSLPPQSTSCPGRLPWR